MANCSNCSPGYNWYPYNGSPFENLNKCYRVQYSPFIQSGTAPILVNQPVSSVVGVGVARVLTFPSYPIGPSNNTPTTTLLPSNSFWTNQTLSGSPANRLFVLPSPFSVSNRYFYGYDVCLPALEEVYYIGVASYGRVKIQLNGIDVLDTNDISNVSFRPNFTDWTIYPINLGDVSNYLAENTLRILSDNSVAFEIYSNTLSQLQSATTTNNLNILSSSREIFINTPSRRVRNKVDVVFDSNGNYLSGHTNPSQSSMSSGQVSTECSDSTFSLVFCDSPISTTPPPTNVCYAGGSFIYPTLFNGYVSYKDCCDNVKTIYNVSQSFTITECFKLNSLTPVNNDGSNAGSLITVSLSSSCTSNCVATTPLSTQTPTITQTKTPTVTPTPTTPCALYASFNVIIPSVDVSWTDCCGNVITKSFKEGNHILPNDGIISGSIRATYGALSQITYYGSASCCQITSTPTTTKTLTVTPTITKQNKFLQCCCSLTPLIIQPNTTSYNFITGQVWTDSNGYCWNVLSGSNYSVNTTYSNWGSFTYFGDNLTNSGTCINCCKPINDVCPPIVTNTPTLTQTQTPRTSSPIGSTPPPTSTNTPTITPTLSLTPSTTPFAKEICIKYCPQNSWTLSGGSYISPYTCVSTTSEVSQQTTASGTYNNYPYYEIVTNGVSFGFVYYSGIYNQWTHQQYLDLTNGGYGTLYGVGVTTGTTNLPYFNTSSYNNSGLLFTNPLLSFPTILEITSGECPVGPRPEVTLTPTLTQTPTSPCNCVDLVGLEILQPTTIYYQDCCGNYKGPFSYNPRTTPQVFIKDCIKLGSIVASQGLINLLEVEFNYCCDIKCDNITPTPTLTKTMTQTPTIGITPPVTSTFTPTPTRTICLDQIPETVEMCIQFSPCSLSDELPDPCILTQENLTSVGYYNGKPYFETRLNLCNTNSTYFIYWSNRNVRWEVRTSATNQVDENGSLYFYLSTNELIPLGTWTCESSNPFCRCSSKLVSIKKCGKGDGGPIDGPIDAGGEVLVDLVVSEILVTAQQTFCSTYAEVQTYAYSYPGAPTIYSLSYQNCCNLTKTITGITAGDKVVIDTECILTNSIIAGDSSTVIESISYTGNCQATSCLTLTPTTTPTITPTNPQLTCYSAVTLNVFSEGLVEYKTCCAGTNGPAGTDVTIFVTTGTTSITPSGGLYGTTLKSRGALIGNITYTGASFPCVSSTPNPTPTRTPNSFQQQLTGLKIEAIFLHSNEYPSQPLPNGYNLVQIPNTYPVEYYGLNKHYCNSARYNGYINGIYLMDINLNNNNTEGSQVGTSCEDKNIAPPWFTGTTQYSRYSSITLSASQATQLASLSDDEQTIDFNIVCSKSLNPSSCYSGQGYLPNECHKEITWMRISRADGTVIFNDGVVPSKNYNINIFK